MIKCLLMKYHVSKFNIIRGVLLNQNHWKGLLSIVFSSISTEIHSFDLCDYIYMINQLHEKYMKE